MTPIRPNVLAMKPYPPGKPISEVKRELGLEKVIKLASNENPFGPSPKAVEAVREAALQMHHYPDGSAYDLKQAIAGKYGMPTSQIFVGNGSDELIHLLGLILLGSPEDEMIVGDPSFSRYDASAYLAPSKLIKVPLDNRFTHDLVAMGRAVTENTKILWIANPNNPTGTIVRRKDVDALLGDIPEQVLVVLDEAYYEFAMGESDYPVSTQYVKSGKNVLGLRTLSKIYGLAGIRIGFGFAPEYIVDAIDRAREPFNVNSLAQVAAIAAFDDEEHLAKTVENNRQGIELLNRVFEELGSKPCESYGNFVYVDLGRPAKPLFDALLREGVITRTGDVFGQPNCLRVTVGTPEEMAFFVEKLGTVARNLKSGTG
ncbi:MAG TPA: histidinol-phosphate transaminase [Fimbriimonas sp.]|nr:histidinol-phosphate transaminase [Fimbriimonas sp.]